MALSGVGRPPLGAGAASPTIALQQQMMAARMASLGGLGGFPFVALGLPTSASGQGGPGSSNLAAALLSLQTPNPFSLPVPGGLSGLSSLVTPPPAPPLQPALPMPLDPSLLAGANAGVGGGGLALGDLLKQLQLLQAASAGPPAPQANSLLNALVMALPQSVVSAPSIPTPPIATTSQPARAVAAPNPNLTSSLLAQMQNLFSFNAGGGGGGGGVAGFGELTLSQLAALNGLSGQPMTGGVGGGTSGAGGTGVGVGMGTGGLAPALFSLDALSLVQPVALDSLSK